MASRIDVPATTTSLPPGRDPLPVLVSLAALSRATFPSLMIASVRSAFIAQTRL